MFLRHASLRAGVARLTTIALAGALLTGVVGAEELTAAHPIARPFTLTPGDPQLEKIFTSAESASGHATDEFTAPAGASAAVPETPIDVGLPDAAKGANGACSPVITSAKGKVTSGGYIVIQGTCLGTSGNVAITGLPSGDPRVTIQAWAPTTLTAQLPTITGVADTMIHIQVRTGAFASKPFAAKFVAALGDPIRLPTRFVANNVCTAGDCSSAPHPPIGVHWDYQERSGTDVWTVTVPEHFHLHAIRLIHLTTGTLSTSTISTGENTRTFKVNWDASKINGSGWAIPWTVTQVTGMFSSTTYQNGTPYQVPTYAASYRVEPLVVGPAGMQP